jgi:hypothetical protein
VIDGPALKFPDRDASPRHGGEKWGRE